MAWQFCETGLDDRAAWEDAVAGVAHSWWHSWEAANALWCGAPEDIVLVSARSGEGARAVCVASKRHWQGQRDLCTPWGYTGFACSGEVDTLPRAWAAYAAGREYVCGYFAIHPAISSGGHFALRTNHELYVLDLRRGADAILQNAHHSVARKLREWQRGGRAFVTDRERIAEFLLRNYRRFMVSKGARTASIWSDSALSMLARSSSVMLVAAEDDHGIRAAHVVGWTPWTGDSAAVVSAGEGREDTIPLVWWAIRELADRKVPFFNLGGGVRPGDALARF